MLKKILFNRFVTNIGLFILSFIILNSAANKHFIISGICISIVAIWNFWEGYYVRGKNENKC